MTPWTGRNGSRNGSVSSPISPQFGPPGAAADEVVGGERADQPQVHPVPPLLSELFDRLPQRLRLARLDEEGGVNGVELVRGRPDHAGGDLLGHRVAEGARVGLAPGLDRGGDDLAEPYPLVAGDVRVPAADLLAEPRRLGFSSRTSPSTACST